MRDCNNCGGPALIHVTDKKKGVEVGWCLDHAPHEFREDVASIRAHKEWQDRQERWLVETNTKASWRVSAASAFKRAWDLSKEFQATCECGRQLSSGCCRVCDNDE